jgi:hypothetical protein
MKLKEKAVLLEFTQAKIQIYMINTFKELDQPIKYYIKYCTLQSLYHIV